MAWKVSLVNDEVLESALDLLEVTVVASLAALASLIVCASSSFLVYLISSVDVTVRAIEPSYRDGVFHLEYRLEYCPAVLLHQPWSCFFLVLFEGLVCSYPNFEIPTAAVIFYW